LPAEIKATTIAGWDYHGGQGLGHVDYSTDQLYVLELDWGNDLKVHNWLFAPEDAVALVFDARVDAASADDIFFVELLRYDGLHRVYHPLSLRSERGWARYEVDISKFSGSVFWFWLYINVDPTFVDSQVTIDNVRFEYIPEPSTLVLLSIGALVLLVSAWWRRRAA